MEVRKALRVGIVATLVCVAEEFILDLFGGGQVIAQAVPDVLAAFLPPVGIGILVGSVVYVALVLISLRKREDDRKKFQIVYELEPLLHVVGLKMKNRGVSEEDKQRAKLAWEKYKKWMPESPDDERLYARLSRISAIMKLYGYRDGVKRIDDEMKSFDK